MDDLKDPKDKDEGHDVGASEGGAHKDSPATTGPEGTPRVVQGGPRLNIKIQADDETARGVYSNSALVNINENEVTLDFVYIPPQSTKGHLRSRVVLTPRQAKQMVRVLGESVQRYERRFGTIPEHRRGTKPVLH